MLPQVALIHDAIGDIYCIFPSFVTIGGFLGELFHPGLEVVQFLFYFIGGVLYLDIVREYRNPCSCGVIIHYPKIADTDKITRMIEYEV